jgi:hypothetical protein
MSEYRTNRDRQLRFRPEALDELADIAGLGRETPQFRRYAVLLHGLVETSLIRLLIGPQAPVPRKARSIAKKTAALLGAIRDLQPDDIQWLYDMRRSFDPPDPEDNSAKDLMLADECRYKREVAARERAPAWMLELSAELDKMCRSAEALAKASRPRGRPPDIGRIILGKALADIFFEYVKRRPTKGRNSAFERTLRICLEASGQDRGNPLYQKDLHTLVATVLDGMEFK